ncbi:MAG TPA: hypothetical protein VH111_01145 [Steroidobacteraceae bacterium]|jgi:hypothetical protein|nr:hypothetical protein [Steroidobacteraceae bacterium]
MWKNIRILILLLVLAGVAIHTWLDRIATQSWKDTLWVGIYPLNGDGTQSARHYIDGLGVKDFAAIEAFFAREAHRYGVRVEQPVHVELYPQGSELPPMLPPDSGPPGIAWWSLKLRWFAWHAAQVPGRAPPRIRIFVLYHDPSTLDTVPDSHGLQKGLVGVVHAFAQQAMAGSNNIVIAHELMHTLGATDKYAPASGEPLYPIGFAEPEREPLYPQAEAEIMAGRRALSEHDFEMPQGLRDVVVGPATALEIHWTRP